MSIEEQLIRQLERDNLMEDLFSEFSEDELSLIVEHSRRLREEFLPLLGLGGEHV